jgi:hypothetical protein
VDATSDNQPALFDVPPGSVFDELIMAGWDPGDDGDPATDPDDEEAWLAGLPDDVRAEYLARPPTPAALWSADGEWLPAAAAAGFAVGGRRRRATWLGAGSGAGGRDRGGA